MAIKIEMLRCFRAVVEHGSLAEAAEALGRTPSAVSMMLRQFEDHLGAPLFETARKSRLTQLGEMINIEARRELEHFGRTVSVIEGMSRARLGHLRLAVTPSVGAAVLPPIVHKFLEAHSGVNIDIRDMTSADVREEMLNERADIGLATLSELPGLERRLLFTDDFGVVCRADDPLARQEEIPDWSALAESVLIINGLCALIGDAAFEALTDNSRMWVPNMTSLLGLVKAGVGITVLPRLALLPAYSDLRFVPVTATAARREVHIVSRPYATLPPVARAFSDALRAARIGPAFSHG